MVGRGGGVRSLPYPTRAQVSPRFRSGSENTTVSEVEHRQPDSRIACQATSGYPDQSSKICKTDVKHLGIMKAQKLRPLSSYHHKAAL